MIKDGVQQRVPPSSVREHVIPDPAFRGESKFRKQSLRGTVVGTAGGLNAVQLQRAEPEVEHERGGFGRVSLIPKLLLPNNVFCLTEAILPVNAMDADYADGASVVETYDK